MPARGEPALLASTNLYLPLTDAVKHRTNTEANLGFLPFSFKRRIISPVALPPTTTWQNKRPNILIGDDHRALRTRLKGILEEAFPDAVIGEAEGARQVLERAHREPWDVVLLDLSMPDGNGLDILPEIKRTHPEMRVLIVSNHSEEQFGAPSLRAGASGYVAKVDLSEQLVDAVRDVLSGGSHFRDPRN